MKTRTLSIIVLLALAAVLGFGAGKQESPAPAAPAEASAAPTADQPIRLGVFVPGRLGDSPPYDGLAGAAERFSLRDPRVKLVNTFEAGFDQSKWIEQLVSFAASGKYDVIYTSNEVMGGLAYQAAQQVPRVKFLVNDAYVRGHERIYTAFINKYEQSYLYGYMMALVSLSGMEGTNPEKLIGLVFGQHYTMMDDLIMPGMLDGARAADAGFELKSAMLGNWFDAKKAESLASNLIDAGVDCLGAIAGSGNPGVIRAAANRKSYVVYYDVAAFDKAPGTIIGSVTAQNSELSFDTLQKLADGRIPWGKPEVLGLRQGYVTVPLRAPGWVNGVPEASRKKFEELYNRVLSGALSLPVPQAVLDKIHNASVAP
jgi:basic membrane lipoprotein Med (substrate-binding protein (PBP1-ABC) superfamily)